MAAPTLSAPFPWFGGKSRCAREVWARFGDVANYVEPFFGSGAVLLARPHAPGIETVNDLDGYVVNFWRALQAAPDAVAEHADNPVFENDLHARHVWLRAQVADLTARLEGDPEFYDAKIAGWWVWGLACWIGSGFCGPSGAGPWVVDAEGRLVRSEPGPSGVARQLVHLGNAGQGVASARGVELIPWFRALAARLRRVRVCSGDWSRVCGPTPTTNHGITGVFLDPPYGDDAGRDMTIYREDSGSVAQAVREWAIANGDNPLMRIALCGYDGEHAMPDGWSPHEWKAKGGYASQGDGTNDNAHRERVWFSPHCLSTRQAGLFP